VGGGILLLLVAILGFFRWQATRREVEERTATAPSTGRFVAAGDADLFVQEAGPPSGDPVVLIHGTGAWSEIWRETMAALGERGFHAIALDLPPFGYSEKLPGAPSYARQLQARRRCLPSGRSRTGCWRPAAPTRYSPDACFGPSCRTRTR
jgi:hypothetical protein